ncbi:MAG: amidase [Pseudomonadota bacterium]
MGDLNHLDATEIAEGVRTGRFTATAVMRDCLDRIEARERDVGAFAHLDPEAAMAAAKAADSQDDKGPLHGVPFGIKDIMDTDFAPTGWGYAAYADHRPARNAVCVELFLAAGAMPVGKTVSTEFAYFNPGKTANPANLAHTPGGSSSGSAAAVADHMLPLAFGTQTAASLIRPAAFCGVMAYKSTRGHLDLGGVMGLSGSLDSLGLLARSARDLTFGRAVLSGAPGVASAFAERPPRLALMRGPHWQDGTMEMREVCLSAADQLRAAGADVAEMAHPDVFERLTDAHKTVMAYEAARARIYELRHFRDQISAQFLALAEAGAALDWATYTDALNTRDTALRLLTPAFLEFDGLVTPAAPGPAPEGLDSTGDPLFSRDWTLMGLPAVAVPAARTPLPQAIQLVGPQMGDGRLLAVADWVAARLGD